MANLRLDLAYDGTEFRGWAAQPGQRSVEGELTSLISGVAGHAVKLSAAGRTDAGVHARQQVVSFSAAVEPASIQAAINGSLSPEVVVWAGRSVPATFDARRSATAREYCYRVNLGLVDDPFEGRYEWHRPGGPSLTAMRRAANDLIGRHDFASFGMKPPEPKTTERTIHSFTIARKGDRLVFTVRSSGFLRQMVRSLIGTLLDVGDGRLTPDSMPAMLDVGVRSSPGWLPPSRGLTLERVMYGSRRGRTTADRATCTWST